MVEQLAVKITFRSSAYGIIGSNLWQIKGHMPIAPNTSKQLFLKDVEK